MDVEENQTEGQEPAIDIGARLCEARDNLGLDSERIAKELNLAVEIITKIEQNIFHQDIPVAFIRGYVKAYSTKVGLDTPKVLAEFDSQTSGDIPSLSRVQSISKFDSGRRELNSNSLVIKSVSAIVILLFLSYGGYEVWKYLAKEDDSNIGDIALSEAGQVEEIDLGVIQSDSQSEVDRSANSDNSSRVDETVSNDNVNIVSQNPVEENLNQNQDSSNMVTQNRSASTADSDSSIQTEKQSQSESELAANQSVTTSQDMTPLVLDFSADCWVRIVDARGEVIALGVKRAGKHMPIEGVKPFNIVLGDPSVVTLQYNNQSYDLSGYRAGRRAEIILN